MFSNIVILKTRTDSIYLKIVFRITIKFRDNKALIGENVGLIGENVGHILENVGLIGENMGHIRESKGRIEIKRPREM